MLTFCSHQEELTGIAGDREGLSGTEIAGVIVKYLDFIGWFVVLYFVAISGKMPFVI